jgi:hypothetical protein
MAGFTIFAAGSSNSPESGVVERIEATFATAHILAKRRVE